MFGNHPLPNIAPSFLSFLPPPTHIPPPLLSWLPLANARMGQARACSSLLVMSMSHHCTPSVPCHHLPIIPTSATSAFLPLPLSRDVGRWIPTPPMPHATSSDKTAHRWLLHHCQQPLPMPCHPIKLPAIECHVTKAEGARRIEMGIGSGMEEGYQGRKRKGNPWVGRRVFVPLHSHSIIPEASEVVCIPHTILFGFPDVSEVVCSPHTILFGLPVQTSGVHPTHPCSDFFLSPPVIWGEIWSEQVGVNTTCCLIQLPLFPPPFRGNFLLQCQ